MSQRAEETRGAGRSLVVIASNTPQSRPQYRRDLLACLCYPSGTIARFSYRKKWIQGGLLEHTEELANQLALVVFCDIPNTANEEFQFYPLRFAFIDDIGPPEILPFSDEDTHFTIKFRLDRYFALPAASRSRILRACQEDFLAVPHRPRPAGHWQEKDGRFLFRMELPDWDETLPTVLRWQELVSVISKSKTLSQCSFFQIIAIQEGPGLFRRRWTDCQAVRYFDYGGTLVRSGRVYRINLEQYRDYSKESAATEITPKPSTSSLTLSSQITKSIGAVTSASFIASCKTVYTPEVATLVLEGTGSQKDLVPRAELVLHIRPAPWLLPVVVILLVLGTLSSGINKDAIESISTSGQWLHRNASAVVYSVKLIGSLLVGLGAYLGFKKLPS